MFALLVAVVEMVPQSWMWLLLVVVTCDVLQTVSGSLGDRSYVFQKCHDRCMKANCTGVAALRAFRYEIYRKL